MGLTQWGTWVLWAAQGCLNTTPTIRPALVVQMPIDYLMDTHKHTFPRLRVKQPLPHNRLRNTHTPTQLLRLSSLAPTTHPMGHIRPIGKSQRAPWPSWTSFERAPCATWDSSKWVTWDDIGAQGRTRWGPWVPFPQQLGNYAI
jgi:hypothetical protein